MYGCDSVININACFPYYIVAPLEVIGLLGSLVTFSISLFINTKLEMHQKLRKAMILGFIAIASLAIHNILVLAYATPLTQYVVVNIAAQLFISLSFQGTVQAAVIALTSMQQQSQDTWTLRFLNALQSTGFKLILSQVVPALVALISVGAPLIYYAVNSDADENDRMLYWTYAAVRITILILFGILIVVLAISERRCAKAIQELREMSVKLQALQDHKSPNVLAATPISPSPNAVSKSSNMSNMGKPTTGSFMNIAQSLQNIQRIPMSPEKRLNMSIMYFRLLLVLDLTMLFATVTSTLHMMAFKDINEWAIFAWLSLDVMSGLCMGQLGIVFWMAMKRKPWALKMMKQLAFAELEQQSGQI